MFLILQETNQPGRLPSDTYFQSRGCVCHHYLLLSLTFVSFLRSHLLDMERGGVPLRAKDIDFLQRFFKKWLPFHMVKSSSLTIFAIWHAANPGSYLGSTMNIHWNQALFGLHLLKWNSDTCHIQIKNSGAKKWFAQTIQMKISF